MVMPSSAPSIAAAVAAIAVGCYLLAYSSLAAASTQKPNRDLGDLDDIDDDDCITPEEVVAIFDKLFMQMQQVVLQLSQQVQQIQMAGQVIPEKQLRQLLKSEFTRALAQCQAQVFEDNDVDADCLEEATWEFLESPGEYPKVKRAVERFQKLYDSMSGEETVGWTPKRKPNGEDSTALVARKDLSAEELTKAATMYFESITEKMVETARSWKESGKDLSNPRVSKEFQLEASTDANDAAEKKLDAEMGIRMSDFRSAIDRHSRTPAVGQTLAMLQIKQQQELMAAGVPMTMSM